MPVRDDVWATEAGRPCAALSGRGSVSRVQAPRGGQIRRSQASLTDFASCRPEALFWRCTLLALYFCRCRSSDTCAAFAGLFCALRSAPKADTLWHLRTSLGGQIATSAGQSGHLRIFPDIATHQDHELLTQPSHHRPMNSNPVPR